MGAEPPRRTLPQRADAPERLARALCDPVAEDPARPTAAEVEEVVQLAERHIRFRQARAHYLDGHVFGEPAWDVLLVLFVAQSRGRMLPVASACLGADVPALVGLRWIDELTRRGLVERTRNGDDRQETYLALAPETFDAMERLLTLELRSR